MTEGFEQSEAILRAILESPKNIVIFALDPEYRYLAFNENHRRTIRAIWGVDIEVGMNMLDIIGREDDRIRAKQNFDRALAGESFTVIEQYGDERMERRYYEDVYSPIHDAEGRVIGLTLYLTDITEQRQAEMELELHRKHLEELVEQRTRELRAAHDQLLHAQKLESLGLMAGGVAHDFNNLLGVILGCASIGLHPSRTEESMTQQLQRISEAAQQASILTDQLLAYSGKGQLLVRPIQLNELLEEMQALLRVSIPKSVKLVYELADDLPAVEVDAAQARQAVMNLVSNGADAVGESGGTVTVRTRVEHLDPVSEPRAYLPDTPEPGDYVCLEVEDDGCGMSTDMQSKIFDPFFSTKLAGRGLGLAAVLGIVRGHEGALRLGSTAGVGTRFDVFLPPSERPPEPLQQTRSASDETGLPQDALALVVDDDLNIRRTTAIMLEILGLRAMQAESGEQACSMFRDHADEIAVVLLDLTMPGMSGEETLHEIRRIRSDVKVLVLSGYTEDEAKLRVVQDQMAGFLHKPFRIETLERNLRRVLGSEKA